VFISMKCPNLIQFVLATILCLTSKANCQEFLRQSMKGAVTPEILLGFHYYGSKDIQDIYAGGLRTQGVPRSIGIGFGLSYGLSDNSLLGVSWGVVNKKYDIALGGGGKELWDVGVQQIQIHGRYRIASGIYPPLSWPWKTKPRNIYIGASVKRIALSGASLTNTFFPGQLELTGNAVGGGIALSSETVLGTVTLFSSIGWDFGKIQPVFMSGQVVGVTVPRLPLPTLSGEDAFFGYSGLSITGGLRLIFGKKIYISKARMMSKLITGHANRSRIGNSTGGSARSASARSTYRAAK